MYGENKKKAVRGWCVRCFSLLSIADRARTPRLPKLLSLINTLEDDTSPRFATPLHVPPPLREQCICPSQTAAFHTEQSSPAFDRAFRPLGSSRDAGSQHGCRRAFFLLMTCHGDLSRPSSASLSVHSPSSSSSPTTDSQSSNHQRALTSRRESVRGCLDHCRMCVSQMHQLAVANS